MTKISAWLGNAFGQNIYKITFMQIFFTDKLQDTKKGFRKTGLRQETTIVTWGPHFLTNDPVVSRHRTLCNPR